MDPKIFCLSLLLSLCACVSINDTTPKGSSSFSVIAHRGASGYLPEHTLEAVAMAHAMKPNFIEPDLVMTKDNHLIVMHDIELDTTTNVKEVFPTRSRKDGHFYAIDFNLSEIKKLHAHERTDKHGKVIYKNRFPLNKSSFEVPTFKEYIELIQGLNKTTKRTIGIYPEIKKPGFHRKEGKDITKAVIKILRKFGYEKNTEQIFIQCFSPKTLKRLKKEFKTKIPLTQLIGSNAWKDHNRDYKKMLTQEGLKEISQYANAIAPMIKSLIKVSGIFVKENNVAKKAHALGLIVHPYIHRSERLPIIFKTHKDYIRFIKNNIKADGVFTDNIDYVLKNKI